MPMYGAAELSSSFLTVRKNTLTIAEEIPEEVYGFRATPDTRSVAEMLAHIAVSPSWPRRAHEERMKSLDFAQYGEAVGRMKSAEAALTAKPQILEALRRGGDEFGTWLGTLSDAVLAERVEFPPPIQPSSKTRFEMLLGVKEHEMHHRAQLMLIERMLGIVPHITRQRQAQAAQAGQPTPAR